MSLDLEGDTARYIFDYVKRNEGLCLEQFSLIKNKAKRLATTEEIEQAARACIDYITEQQPSYVPLEMRTVECVRDLARMSYACHRVVLPIQQVVALVPEILPLNEAAMGFEDEVTEPDLPETLLLRSPLSSPTITATRDTICRVRSSSAQRHR